MCEVISTTLYLLQSKGLYGGSEHEYVHEHIWCFTEVCTLLSFNNLSQHYIRLRLFPFSLTVKQKNGWSNYQPTPSRQEWYWLWNLTHDISVHRRWCNWEITSNVLGEGRTKKLMKHAWLIDFLVTYYSSISTWVSIQLRKEYYIN